MGFSVVVNPLESQGKCLGVKPMGLSHFPMICFNVSISSSFCRCLELMIGCFQNILTSCLVRVGPKIINYSFICLLPLDLCGFSQLSSSLCIMWVTIPFFSLILFLIHVDLNIFMNDVPLTYPFLVLVKQDLIFTNLFSTHSPSS